LLAAGFLIFKDFLARFAQALFVLGGARFGGCDVGPRFFHGTLRTLAALVKNGGQGPINQYRIKAVQDRQKDDRGHGSEQ
jgi:hypothetical protein